MVIDVDLRSKLVGDYRLLCAMSGDGNRDTMPYLAEATRVISQTTRYCPFSI